LKSKHNISKWIKNHISPHIGYKDDSDKLYNNRESEITENEEDWKDKIRKNVIIGAKIKWRF
jgi:hypothetical protein